MFNFYMQHVKGYKNSRLINFLLTPLTWISGFMIATLNFLRGHGLLKTDNTPLPLISVGNLTYGGTNKTPFVEMLSEYMLSKNIKTGIVTRGYTGKSHDVILIHNGKGNRDLTGDEPLLLSQRLPDVPVAVAKKRLDGIFELQKSGCEIVIADDAFQHKNLARDLDIVLIDATCPFGSGKLIPAGILREKISALSRAGIVVLTKTDQTDLNTVENLRKVIEKYIAPEKIFTSIISHDGWILNGTDKIPQPNTRVFAFSAIGSPESFVKSLEKQGLIISGIKNFTDHHKYKLHDLENLCVLAEKSNAEFMACTEKDLFNLPEKWNMKIPLITPKIRTVIKNPEEFFKTLTQALRPKIVIASNGFGEDAIGVILAQKLRKRLPEAKIFAFPLVGKGDAYLKSGFEIKSAPSVTPSGGVLKYSLRDLLGDMRAGLLKHVSAQLNDWKKIANEILTPLCVGDVYLLLHTLWGSGARPVFMATAKTVYLSGHWKLERALINKFTLKTWARDNASALELGKKAVYSGNPIMDILFDGYNDIEKMPEGREVLLLPGSRPRALKDVKLLLDAAVILKRDSNLNFRMVIAPTIDYENFLDVCKNYGWEFDLNTHEIYNASTRIELTQKSIAAAANGIKILIGLGGTANQLCAGLGIPVISINEKGKRVQKKLLGNAEILVKAEPEALAQTTLEILNDPKRYKFMSDAGRERMGTPGAIDGIINYVCDELGWDVRENVYKKLSC